MGEHIDICEEILTALRRITRAIDLHSKSLHHKYGITGPQMLILKVILTSQTSTPGKIAKKVSLSQATVSSILDRLVKQGYVERCKSDKDKRVVDVIPTQVAIEIFKNGYPSLLQEHFIDRLDKINEWEQTLILSSLQRIAYMMDAEDLSASPVLASHDELNKI